MKVWQQDWISRWALYSPDKTALEEHESGKTCTYRQLNQMANGFVYSLTQQYHLQKGDRIVVLAEYSISLIALFSAIQKSGIIMVPLNYRLSANEVAEIISDADPSLILYENQFLHLIPENNKNLEFSTFVSLSEGSDQDVTVPVEEDDSLFIIYTSGTTGKPKGVKYTHKMAFWNSVNTSISLKLTSESRTINVMPPFHTGGWNVLLLPFLHHGAYTYVCRKFEPEIVLEKLSSLRCTIFMGVPTMLSMMAMENSFEKTDISCLDYMIVGGESMPIPLIRKYAEKGVAIRQGYGMTEVGPNLTSLHQDDAIRKIGSIGRPNFYVRHRIVNEEGKDAGVNQSGELWLRGPMVTPGYWHNEEAGKHAFSEDGLWFKTGDIVREDEDKYLYIVDRLKNMFISGGENVYPAEIERVLRQIPEVKDCAVTGVKDDKWGEVGKAFLVLNAPVAEEKIKSFCLKNLAKFKIPKHFVYLESLPRTDSGKIDKKALKIY